MLKLILKVLWLPFRLIGWIISLLTFADGLMSLIKLLIVAGMGAGIWWCVRALM